MRITWSATIRAGAILLLIAAIADMAWIGQAYRRDRNSWQQRYTRTVKQRDIYDDARKAMSALQDGELQVQDYVLTGETAYSEAYAADIRQWQDEFGTLEIEAEHDPATPLVQDLSKAATRVLNELTAIVALADKGSRDAALDRIRKGSDIVYLEQSRDIVADIQRLDGLQADEVNQALINGILLSQRRVAAGALGLFCLAVAGPLLLAFEIRRQRRFALDSSAGERSYVKTTN